MSERDQAQPVVEDHGTQPGATIAVLVLERVSRRDSRPLLSAKTPDPSDSMRVRSEKCAQNQQRAAKVRRSVGASASTSGKVSVSSKAAILLAMAVSSGIRQSASSEMRRLANWN